MNKIRVVGSNEVLISIDLSTRSLSAGPYSGDVRLVDTHGQHCSIPFDFILERVESPIIKVRVARS